MSINREKVLKAFQTYTNQFDKSNQDIALKITHSYKVAELSERIGRSLKRIQDDSDIFWTVGLLHDIGRFEQIKAFRTFVDSVSIDHAVYGADFLFREHHIDEYKDTDRWNCIIERAIRYHNTLKLPADLDEETNIFCTVLRDADKLDIFRVFNEIGAWNIYKITKETFLMSTVSPAVADDIRLMHTVDNAHKSTYADRYIGLLSLYFELNYDKSRSIANNQGYFRQLLDIEAVNSNFRNTVNEIGEIYIGKAKT